MVKIDFKKRIVVVGHYGSGKTEFALNLAFKLRETGEKVTIIDLDIVNPYFRTKDAEKELTEAGIDIIAPVYANTNVDVPALPPNIYAAFEKEGYVIFDVGGDDDGATVLGRFKGQFDAAEYDMLGVVNTKRPLTTTKEEIVESLSAIERVSRLKFTGIINNTNISVETTPDIINSGTEICAAAAKELGTSLKLVSALEEIADTINADEVFPIKIRLKKW
ncbi:MAG: hypothetical protein IJY55_01995 [Clostridia bacterium]|nr:hypothetical protein [Clostridia bacterium]